MWVKDSAGNMADLKVIKVNDDFSIEIDPKEIVVDDDKPQIPDEEMDDKVKDKEKDKKDTKENDDTPQTGDTSLIMIAAALLLLSGISILAVKAKRNKIRY